MKWAIVYEKAIRDDGSLFFPQKLSQEFLDSTKRAVGSYIFSNQYLNEIIPSDLQSFKREWFTYFKELPSRVSTFIFVDPAISQADTADYTGVVVISVSPDAHWFVRFARRYKITPTQLIDLIFKLNTQFSPMVIGIEEVAYQKALLYFLHEEMRRRDVVLPIKGIKPPNDKTKEMRILSLVPRFEFGRISLAQGLTDLELELLKFPRGSHDDLIDALASCEYITVTPDKEKRWAKPPQPNHPDYERYIIEKMRKGENDTAEITD